ncbi:MAG: 23S rRNA (uracil(1939)-C(5))-methyltransferase RlmD, partial [Melioribacteraceae bacterium]|nr:23S rRNA (uracil(1939)-C(5))-methyltransferase RlmD [Melioribacteraceae bacterium]
MNLKKGDVIELEISKYAFEGKGIGKIKLDENDESAYVVFVDKTYPGDKVKASYSRIKKSYAEARLEEILEKSVDRTEPKCTHFGVCGGCKQQDLKYEVQAEYKELQV